MTAPWIVRSLCFVVAVALVFLVLGPGAIVYADDDDSVDQSYDRLAPDERWQQSIRLPDVPAAHDGTGATVAILDTGVTRHPDLGDRLLARVDLTPEGDGFDRYGHGTHMTGLVAGDGSASGGRWTGAAPGAKVVTVKVAGWQGATDVSMVMAGLEWIAAHRARFGIRVVNLSYGTDSSQKWSEDPLNLAVERLWNAGVLVVVGAGNRGDGGSKIDKPGDDPHVLTVGAAATRRTATPADDDVATFSARGPTGEGVAKPDVLAPGVSIVSHHGEESLLSALRPAARLDGHYFKGTGTSQAAAIVTGVAARMFGANPQLTPDEAKAALVGTAQLTLVGRSGAGAGLIDAAAAVAAAQSRVFAATPANQGLATSSGTGAIDSTRGSFKPYTDWKERGKPEQLSGEFDVFGAPWNGHDWRRRAWDAANWAASEWGAHTTVAEGWQVAAPAAPWSGLGWNEGSWIAKSWGGADPGTGGDWIAKSWGWAAPG